MSRFRQSLQEVFDAYGDDAEAGLYALAQTDPPFWSAYVDAAASKQYKSDYRRHRDTRIVKAKKDAVAKAKGQVQLFDPGDTAEMVELRAVLVLEGTEYDLAKLAGHEGAAIVRRVAERDLKPALTSITRNRYMLRLSEHVVTETDRLGRAVTFAEALGWDERRAA
jgi:hypothetical protein